ncbi:MAG: asparaginase [Bacteroidales bacterium]|nr:asparaginase [Bacteroidales bacterium]
MKETSITFIQTGGTIDKDYPRQTKGWAFEIGDPAFNRILKKIEPSFHYEVIELFKKDSLEITLQDRNLLVESLKKIENKYIIITHGTDTMIETAIMLNKYIQDKIIIITGAMRPERFTNSDAEFNLGCAVGAVFTLNVGIYIAMHGIVKNFRDTKRNLDTGKYY